MLKPTLLLSFLITALLPAHAHAQNPGAATKPKTAAKSTKGRSSKAQLIAAYTVKAKAAMAATWADALKPRMADFAVGSVTTTFKLDAEGKVAEFAVTANTSNEAFAKFCEEFVRATKFEKPPVGALTEGQLEIPFTFTIL